MSAVGSNCAASGQTMRKSSLIRIHPAKTADQPRLRADGPRVDFLARLCTA